MTNLKEKIDDMKKDYCSTFVEVEIIENIDKNIKETVLKDIESFDITQEFIYNELDNIKNNIKDENKIKNSIKYIQLHLKNYKYHKKQIFGDFKETNK